jgi:putative molybdopterin biosynthesis protein
VAILPGFPTSAVFTFHEFVAPILREMGGSRPEPVDLVTAALPVRVNSERGRTEYLLVHIVQGADGGLTAYPMGKGSGSVTAFSRADGFVTIAKHQEYIEAGEPVSVVPLGRGLAPTDLTVIGSHCVGLDTLLGVLAAEAGFTSKTIWVGSQGGLSAAARGECDLAGVHLLDPRTGCYNQPFLPPGVGLIRGYGRMQGIVFREGDQRFEGRTPVDGVAVALSDSDCLMVNRNRGSGSRILIDGLLAEARPPGHAVEARSHNAVAAAVASGRADWGVAIEPVARSYGLGFCPLRAEHYDFAVPDARVDRPAVRAFRALLERPDVRDRLAAIGFLTGPEDDA